MDIHFTFSPVMSTATMRYIDVWSATATTGNCQQHASRQTTTGTPVCTHVTGTQYTPVSNSATVPFSASTLFGGCGTNATRTFYFFDAVSNGENTMDYSTYWVITITLTATPPMSPTITVSSLAGDQVVQIPWNSASYASATLGTMGQVHVYADPTGCGSSSTGDGGGGDAGTTTSTLLAGGPVPGSPIASSSATSPISFDTSALHWSSSHYGETAAIAIAVSDSGSNYSMLSNVVCLEHVHIDGFWDQYCAEHGMTDTTACAHNYSGCSIGVAPRRADLGAWIAGLAVVGLLVARRRRRVR
jgi:MYXO-CTERM domain-containing protein